MYIHYGHKQFLHSKFNEIVNDKFFCKPYGGLWASPVGAERGWKNWCDENGFRECKEENSFTFELSETANVLHIRSRSDLEKLPRQQEAMITQWIHLDFEKIKASGVDAIELHLSEDWELHWTLYGWDCDSILIMNPDIVCEVMP